MIEVNRAAPFTSAVIAVTAESFPNVFVGVTDMPEGRVVIERQCEDGEYRSYRETTFTIEGARLLSLPAGNYRVRVADGTTTVEVTQL